MDSKQETRGPMRFSDEELAIIQSTFKGNDRLLKLMRKVFLPEYNPYAPLGQVIDLWMSIDLKNLTTEEKLVRIEARNSLIVHVEGQIMQLNALANLPVETPEQKKKRQEKDSSK